jgi:hypothetical protein
VTVSRDNSRLDRTTFAFAIVAAQAGTLSELAERLRANAFRR